MDFKITEDKAIVHFDNEFSIAELKDIKDIIKEIENRKIVKIMFDFRNVFWLLY